MRRSLLNKRILPKPLRQALVLITLLLLPSAAWGEEYTYSSFSSWDSSLSDYLYWDFQNNPNQVFRSPEYYSYISKIEIEAGAITQVNSTFEVTINGETKTITATTNATGGTINDANMATYTYTYTPDATSKQIEISASYDANSGTQGWVFINNVTVYYSTPYGLTIGETALTSDNVESDGTITGITGITGTVKFTPADEDTPATLTMMNNASLSSGITSSLEALNINFEGKNTIDGGISLSSAVSEGSLAFAFIGTGNGDLSISSSSLAISGFSSVDFGNLNLASISAPGIYWNEEYNYLSGFEGPALDVTITTEKYYPIWIKDPSLGQNATHTQLKSDKLSVTMDDGTVSFDGNDTITINAITFNYNSNTLIVVGPDMEQLTVNLVGTSTVISESLVFNLWDTTALTFTTNKNSPGSLSAPSIISWHSEDSQSQGGQISYENGLVYNYESSPYRETISTTGVRIKIGKSGDPEEISGSTDENGLFGGTVFFDASNNTLTLKGATLGNIDLYGIQVFVDDLKVVISGDNTIIGDIKYIGNNNLSSSIQINKADGDAPASLTLENINSFGACTWGEGLYLTGNTIAPHYEAIGAESCFNDYKESTASEVIFSTTVSYPLWVGGVQVTDDNKDGITGVTYTVGQESFQSIFGTVSFNPDGNILTLTDASVGSPLSDCEAPIISNLPNLEININKIDRGCHLEGYQNGFIDDGSGCAKSLNTDATLVFSTNYTSSSEAESPTMQIDCYDPIASGFKSIGTSNQIIYKRTSNYYWVQRIAQPTMSLVNGSLQLSDNNEIDLNYDANSAVTLKYKITDAAGTAGEEKIFDSNTIEPIENPCTIEAWAEYQDQESDLVTGKYFGFAESMVLTTLASETEEKEIVLPALLPATEENDGITFELSSENENIIYKNDDSKWMIKGYGNTSISAVIGTDDTTPFTVLNEGTSLVVNVLHDPIFTAYYGEDNTKVYDGNGSGNVSVEISSSDDDDFGSEYTLMYYLGTNNTTPTPYEDPISLNATTTVNAFIRYVNPANSSITYDSEPVSMEYLVSQKLDTPAFEGSINFQTCYLKDYSLAKPAGLKVYIITEISLTDNTLKAVSIDYIPKYVPVLLEKEGETPEGGYVAATYTGEEGEFSSINKLYYTDYQIDDLTGTEYVLFNNEFVKATGIIAAGHCYLSLDGPHANTRGFSIDTSGNGTTGINHASLHDSREVMTKQWYDLQGRKIQKPTKAGLYIVNGKKVVIK